VDIARDVSPSSVTGRLSECLLCVSCGGPTALCSIRPCSLVGSFRNGSLLRTGRMTCSCTAPWPVLEAMTMASLTLALEE
jgi:hypothetical protein